MRRLFVVLAVLFVAGFIEAAVTTDITQRQVRDPRQFAKIWDDTVGELNGTSATTDGVGAVNGATVVATETRGIVQSSVLALDDVVVIVDGSAGVAFGGTKIYDFPEGRILVLGVTVDSVIVSVDTNHLDAADGGDWSFGTTITADATLDGTDVDLAPKTSADPINGTNSTALVASAQFDGTTTAKDFNINMIIDDADIGAVSATNTVDATVTVNWINLGDY